MTRTPHGCWTRREYLTPFERFSSANREDLPMTTPDQPGWYDDPNDSSAQRYWDGQDWTPHRQRKPISRQTRAPVTPPPLPSNLPPPLDLPPPPPPSNLPPPPPPDQQAQWPPPGQTLGGSLERRSQLPIPLMAVIGAVAVLAVAGVLVYKFVLSGGSTSPEGQIRALVKTFTTDFNNADGAALATIMCGQPKQTSGFSKALTGSLAGANVSDMISEQGTITTAVSNIRVTGDRATATVTTTWSKSPNEPTSETDLFVKENGSWKVCGTNDGSG